MSNPAVITLDSLSNKNLTFKRFQIEDNIGESIHLHIDNMRIDFTVKEFLEFSKMIENSLCELNFLKGYNISDFDEHFLKECSPLLTKLVDIKIENIQLSQLKCIVHVNYKNGLSSLNITSIQNTPAYQYLKGNKEKFIHYQQYNYFNINNEQRLLSTLKSIETNKYLHENRFIILFNGQNYIRDGQHRAAILAHLYGLNINIKVMRFYFKEKKHYINQYVHNAKIFIKWFMVKIYKKVRFIFHK
ncbi:hypothetical protein KY334_05550 [Candidatus Woesearchaeota archaeon]|nr:hypothetical protein [Candidatus Woesearchaeota archaeon]